MSDVIEYIVKLKDELSGKLSGVEKQSEHLNKTMGGLKEVVKGVGIAMGAYFAIDKIAEFASESVKAFNESEQAAAQLRATISSTGGVGLSFEQLADQAKALQKITLFDDDSIIKMDSVLGTFTQVKGVIAQDAVPAILDLSAKMGQDLQSSAVQVGKALNDPIKGIGALRKVGVSFTAEQENVIKTLATTGHVAEVQAMILKELNTEFGGSAQAAYDAAPPMARLANRIGDLKERIGEHIVQLQEKLAPIMIWIIESTENTITWMEKHKDILMAVGVGIGVAAVAWGIYAVATSAAAIATVIMTAGQWLLNAALTANPIGIIIMAIGAFAAGIYMAYQKSETFRAILKGLWYVIKDDLFPILKAYGEIWLGIVTFSPDTFVKGVESMGDAIKNLKNIKRDLTAGITDSLNEKYIPSADNPTGPNMPKGWAMNPKSKTGGATAIKSESSVTGSKSLNIKIDIREMIGVKNFTSTGSQSMDMKTFGQKVLEVMTTAINDAQIITE